MHAILTYVCIYKMAKKWGKIKAQNSPKKLLVCIYIHIQHGNYCHFAVFEEI